MNTNLLKSARISKGYTQKELALKMGITSKSYNEKENGIREFRNREIEYLSNELKLNLNEINAIFFDKKLTDWLIS